MGEPALCLVLSTSARSAGYNRWVNPCFVSYILCGLHQMSEPRALCRTLCVGYTRWVNLRFVWYSLCGLHQMGELALCVVLFTSARSAGYTRWVSLRFVWYSLLPHVVRVTPDG